MKDGTADRLKDRFGCGRLRRCGSGCVSAVIVAEMVTAAADQSFAQRLLTDSEWSKRHHSGPAHKSNRRAADANAMNFRSDAS